MNDRSVLGKMYRGCWSGSETLTGLSRLNGGLCCGNNVCLFFATSSTVIFSAIPGRWMITGTFPSRIEVEKDLLGPPRFKGSNAVDGLIAVVLSNVWPIVDFLRSVIDTESCRSWAQGRSVDWAKGGPRLRSNEFIVFPEAEG